MKTVHISYVSWVATLLAFLAWGGGGFLAWSVSVAETTRPSEEASFEEKASKIDTTLQLRALARETKDLREALETLTHVEVVSIVEAIEAVGRDTRTSLKVDQVTAGHPLGAASPSAPSIRPVSIAIEAEGSFEALLQAAALLHALPIPSEVEQMRFEHLPPGADTKKGTWQFSARIQVLTTAAIS